MTKKLILVPTCAFAMRQSFEEALIRELCEVDPKEWSPRESRLMNEVMAHGELYHMSLEEVVGEHESYLQLKTDLGDSDSIVAVQLPLNFDRKKAIEAFQKFAEELCG